MKSETQKHYILTTDELHDLLMLPKDEEITMVLGVACDKIVKVHVKKS